MPNNCVQLFQSQSNPGRRMFKLFSFSLPLRVILAFASEVAQQRLTGMASLSQSLIFVMVRNGYWQDQKYIDKCQYKEYTDKHQYKKFKFNLKVYMQVLVHNNVDIANNTLENSLSPSTSPHHQLSHGLCGACLSVWHVAGGNGSHEKNGSEQNWDDVNKGGGIKRGKTQIEMPRILQRRWKGGRWFHDPR